MWKSIKKDGTLELNFVGYKPLELISKEKHCENELFDMVNNLIQKTNYLCLYLEQKEMEKKFQYPSNEFQSYLRQLKKYHDQGYI